MKTIGEKANIVSKNDPELVERFDILIEKVAQLSYEYKNQILYFRGQDMDYWNKANRSTLYPSIYRGIINSDESNQKFRLLELSCNELVTEVINNHLEGCEDIRRKELIQWSILQHYQICETPLIDLTHSLRVACSFAIQETYDDRTGYIYVIALPYLTNRITLNSEENSILIRLLSIAPPGAKRPYYQEGYMAGTTDIKDKYQDKDELDFNLRLVGKFSFKNNERFWGKHFSNLDKDALYPKHDNFFQIAEKIRLKRQKNFLTGTSGEYMKKWNQLYSFVLNNKTDKKYNITQDDFRYVINQKLNFKYSENIVKSLYAIRKEILHDNKTLNEKELENNYEILLKLVNRISSSQDLI